jgi:hypothetical protein
MTISINQPAYLPWLGYFDRIAKSDVHVVLDHVQFEKNSMTNRNKIRTAHSWVWLTVPVQSKGLFGSNPIRTLRISDTQSWERKHLNAIQLNYSRCEFFNQYFPFFKSVYERKWILLADLIKEINTFVLSELDIKTPILYSSDMSLSEKKDKLILEVCEKTKATAYLSGPFGRDYLQEADFEARGIKLRYQDYKHPVYKQPYPDFLPFMSVLDLLMNEGPDSKHIFLTD